MIDTILIYLIIGCIAYVANDLRKGDEEEHWYIERESDATIEVVAGRYILKEK